MFPFPTPLLMVGQSAAPPAGWQPTSLASLKAQWVADDLVGANGSQVTTWTDREGNANGTGGGTGNTLVMAGPNSHQAIAFAGTNTSGFALGTTFMVGETAGSYFAVFKRTTDPAAAAIEAGAVLDGFTGNSSQAQFPWTDGHIYDGFGSASRMDVGNPAPSLTSWRLYSAHSAANDWRSYLDGTQLFSTATNTVNFGSGKSKFIGKSFSNTNSFYGQLAEVLVFNSALTTSDRQKVEGYLAWKYGLQGNLPAGHPYKSAAPT